MTFEVEAPSGARFEFKPIGGEQIIAIGDRAAAGTSSDTLITILSGCCVGILDRGPYPFLEEGKTSPPWTKLLTGDMMASLLRLRVESFDEAGADYEFDFACEHCGRSNKSTMSLLELLEHPDTNRALPEASADMLREGQALKASIPARYAPVPAGAPEGTLPMLISPEIKVTFDLHRPAQDVLMRAVLKRNDRKKVLLPEFVATQLKSVEGLVTAKNNEPVRDLAGLWGWCKKQSAGTLDNLLAQMRAADCGIDPVVMVWCENPDCGKEQRVALPFGRTFWSPRSGATRKASTTKAASPDSSSPA